MPNEDFMRPAAAILCVVLVAFSANEAAQDRKKTEPGEEKPKVVRDRVKGSIHHAGGRSEWQRITGKAKVLDARTLLFEDGTRIPLLLVAPDLDQMGKMDGSLYPCGKEAAAFLRQLIGDRPVTCFLVVAQGKWFGYVGDTNIEHAMILNGWALAHHSGMNGAEIIARENRRGLWRGQFLDPDDWRAGKRLPGEK
jgi:endonuclease YncB( thermonuclease family)